MPRFLPLIVIGFLMIFCIVDLAQADSARIRRAPKWLWAVAIVLLPGIGSLAWLFLGRPLSQKASKPKSGPIAPDDDPDFLRGLR
ncbi:MAG: PLD nuclease N-terminal domain-containing protein [Propionibacteriaceae bacterium]|nr:PLD nuclease N-terminal domain-containing protein [Propionibacteriaceae bacterium]